jgi:hypothetical protein
MKEVGLWKVMSVCRRNMRGAWREGSFTGDTEEYVK